MGLSSALNTALIGLGFNQRQLDVTASNIANADQPGYTRKSLTASVAFDGLGRPIGLSSDELRRALDTATQRQYWTALSQQQYASIARDYTSRLDQLFGTIGDPGSLSTVANAFVGAFASLVATPEDYSTRLEALTSAQTLASKLNTMSQDIQGMRQEVEQQIGDAVARVNTLLSDIQSIDRKIIAQSSTGQDPVAMLDERDRWLEELATYLDIEVKPTEQGGVRVMTASGLMLYDVDVLKLEFDGRGSIGPTSRYDTDPEKRGVGTILLKNSEGHSIDLLSVGGLRSGSIAGLVEMRDRTLVDAQRQLDEMAANLALAFSTHKEAGTPYVDGGNQVGYDLDLAAVKNGDSLSFSYLDTATGRTKEVTIYRSDGAEPPELTASRDPNRIFLAVDFSSGDYDAIAASIQSALNGDSRVGSGTFAVSHPAGSTTLRIESANPTATAIKSAQTNVNATGLSDHGDAFPMFVGDGGEIFSGLRDGRPAINGFAASIRVNADLLADASLLVQYTAGIAAGDPTRPQAILDKLTSPSSSYTAAARVGGRNSVFQGSLQDYVTAIVSFQTGRASQANAAATGQEVATNNLKARLDASSKVDVDEELGMLIQLENAYTANARVMEVVRDLFDTLMRL